MMMVKVKAIPVNPLKVMLTLHAKWLLWKSLSDGNSHSPKIIDKSPNTSQTHCSGCPSGERSVFHIVKMFFFHASFMCRFHIILQCLLIIADYAAEVAHLLCPLGKTQHAQFYRAPFVILMLIKHHHQCTWNKSKILYLSLYLCHGHSPLTSQVLIFHRTIRSRIE